MKQSSQFNFMSKSGIFLAKGAFSPPCKRKGIHNMQGLLRSVGLALVLIFLMVGFGNYAKAQPYAYIPNSTDKSVSVIDLSTNTVIKTITVGSYPIGVDVNQLGTKAYISNYSDNTVSVIDVATNTVTATIIVGAGPYCVASTPNGSKVFVTNTTDNSVSVINGSTNEVTTISGFNVPIGVAVNPAGTKVYVANFSSNTVSVIDAAGNSIITTINVGTGPNGVCINQAGTKAYITNYSGVSVSVIDLADNTVTNITVGDQPIWSALTPDGTKLFTTNSANGTVSVINTSTNLVIATIAVGNVPSGVCVNQAGTKAYVTDVTNKYVSIIDVATNTVSATTILVGGYPYAMGKFMQAGTPADPIHVAATGGTLSGDYSTLKAAFDAINAGTHTGVINISVNSNTTETASAVLNQNAGVTSVKIYPTASGLSITGNIAAPLIDLNGADNVTIDGSVNAAGTNKDLIISNTSTSAVAGTSTIRFINDASTNTVKYCTLKGSGTSIYPAFASGVIYLSTTTGTTGNDNITIDNCNITNAGGNRPTQAICSNGTSGKVNGNLTISNSYIYDFLNQANASNGIYTVNTTDCSVTNNSFYETTTFTPSANVNYTIIWITFGGGNHTISGNYIGGKAITCGGGAWTTNATASEATMITVAGNATTSNIQGNTIKNISWTNSNISNFGGIVLISGVVNVGTTTANTIGASTGTGSITFTNGVSDGNFIGIYDDGASATSVISNNIIGSITVSAATGYANFYGIIVLGATRTVSNNSIGSATTANSINATGTSSASGQSVIGIWKDALNTVTFSGNNIANLTNSCENAGAKTLGIWINAGTAVTVEKNFIHSFTSTSVASNISGIYCGGGTATYKNNIISIAPSTAVSTINGIYDAGGTNSIYFNTVNISGADAGTTTALLSTGTNTRNYRNNIFSNTRTGGTSKAVNITSTTNLTIGYNDYVGTLTGITLNTAPDNNSINADPLFANPTALIPDLNLTPGSPCEAIGTLIGSVTDDYLGQVRSTLSPTDIGAYAGNFTSTLTSATYDAYTGVLVVTGTNLESKAGANDIDASMFTITGEDGATYTLTTTPDVEISSATSFTITLDATDKAAVNQIINKNGSNSTINTAYNLAAAANWCTNVSGATDLTGNVINASNVAVPTITSATYDASSGILAVSGAEFKKYAGATNDIDVSKLAIHGDASDYVLTSPGVEISNGTSFSVTLNATDKNALSTRINKNGTSSLGSVTYNLIGIEDWHRGADAVVTIADLIGNGITVSGVKTTPTLTTTAIAEFDASSATMGGNVTNDGGSTVTERGVVYSSTNATPELLGANVTSKSNGTGTGSFSESIGSLLPGTLYYVQAYATNADGTNYGGVQTFTTSKIALTISGVTGTDKPYDKNTTATLSGTPTLVGLVTGANSVTLVAGTHTFADYALGINKPITTAYTLSGTDAVKYTLIQPTVSATIYAKPITVTADAGKTKVYGAVDPTFTYNLSTPLVTGDVLTGSLSRATGENVGSSYAITVGTLANANYAITLISSNFSITQKALTVTANIGQSKVYGAGDPTFTYSLSEPLVAGSTLSGALSRAAGENVGSSYAITIGTLANSNYAIAFVGNNFSIRTKTLTVTADDKSKIAGEVNPVFTFTYSGFEGSDNASSLATQPTASCVATNLSPKGTYAINVIGGVSTNYAFTYINGTLTVNPSDEIAPTVAFTSLAGQTAVHTFSPIVLTFSETVTSLAINSAIIIRKGGIAGTNATFTASINQNVVTVNATLDCNSSYYIAVQAGSFEDLAGNKVALTATNFQTDPLPTKPVIADNSVVNGSKSICADGVIECSNFNTSLAYQWLLGGNAISNQTSNQFVVPANGGGVYSLSVSDNLTRCSNVSEPLTINMYALETPVVQEKKEDGIISILVVDNTSNAFTNYLWTYSNGSALPAGVDNNRQFLVLSASTMNGQYMVQATDKNGCKVLSGVKTVSLKNMESKIYPTVNSGSFNVEVVGEQTGKVNVGIYNQFGVVLKTYSYEKMDKASAYQIDGANIPAGMYNVIISTNNYRKSHKIVIQ